MGVMEHHSKESAGFEVDRITQASLTIPFSVSAGVGKGVKNMCVSHFVCGCINFIFYRYQHVWPFPRAPSSKATFGRRRLHQRVIFRNSALTLSARTTRPLYTTKSLPVSSAYSRIKMSRSPLVQNSTRAPPASLPSLARLAPAETRSSSKAWPAWVTWAAVRDLARAG